MDGTRHALAVKVRIKTASLSNSCMHTSVGVGIIIQTLCPLVKYCCLDSPLCDSISLAVFFFFLNYNITAGCAQGCVFCATGQQGFFRQLSSEEIFEQVARFSQMLQQKDNNNSNDEPETNEKSTHGKTTRLSK